MSRGIFTGLRCEQAQQDRNVQRKIYAKSEKRQALRLPICNDFSRLVCRYETLRHKAVALQLPCWCYQNFLPWAHKSAIYGEGSGPKHQLEGPKSAISEKELANFELRKVLFSEKHLRELPGAFLHTLAPKPRMKQSEGILIIEFLPCLEFDADD